MVLGKNGFVAKSLINHLIKTKQKYVAVSKEDCDLTDKKSIEYLKPVMQGVSTVVMPAAISPSRNYLDVETTSKMAYNLSLVLEDYSNKHLILVSSDSVYGDDSNLYSENSKLNPNSFHGISQITRELIFQNSNLKNLAILRCCGIFGIADTHNSYGPNRFLRNALKSENIKLFGKGFNKRDHVYIDDVISLIDKVSFTRFTGILNIASGNSYSFLEVAKIIIEVFESKSQIELIGDEGIVREKNFDISKLINNFPDHIITNLREGLSLIKNKIA